MPMLARARLVYPVLVLASIVLAAIAASPVEAQLVRVPQDEPTLQRALDRLRTGGGTIELAAGTYAAPAGGFRLRNPGAELTVRAAAGAEVVLDGGNATHIFTLERTGAAGGPRIFFERLTFRNGLSSTEKRGAGMSVIGARASFLSCTFEGNRAAAPTTGGGAILIFDGADVVVLDTLFDNNSSFNRGGAISVVFSTLEVHDSSFDANRTDIAGHADNAAGGAIYVFDSKVRVATSQLQNNGAGWVGGAIYVLGTWRAPLANPAAEVQIFDSAFLANRARSIDPATPPGLTGGGAVHAEDHATVRIYRSLFELNRAEGGGAINNYRAVVEVFDSIFRGNLALPQNRPQTFGGTFFLTSSDFADGSTGGGAINRRPASLHLEGSLVQGEFAGTTVGAQNGGCLAAVGDFNRLFGQGGVDQDGTVEANRARVVVRESAFVDCLAEGLGMAGDGFGGAINLRLVDLSLADSLVLDSDCSTDNCGGGGIFASEDSLLAIDGGAVGGNGAHRGGGIFLGGSTIAMSDALVVDNEISAPGGTTDIRDSRGAGIFAIPGFSSQPSRELDVAGVVEDTIFAHNRGVPAFDVDVDFGPHNTVRYDRNDFGPTTFPPKVYVNRLVRASGETAAELNALVVRRGDGTSTDKSSGGNRLLGSAPAAGVLLAVPRQLIRPGIGSPAPSAFHAFAWSGGNATLGGQPLAERTGLRAVSTAGSAALRVGGTTVGSATLAVAPCSGGPLLCLNDDRFKLFVDWRTPRDEFGPGIAVPLTPDTGYFFFFNPSNVEMVVKVLTACGVNRHYWVFAGGLTNVETTLRVTDSLSGEVETYRNPRRTPFQPIQDTGAFRTCDRDALTALPDAAAPPASALAEVEGASLAALLAALGGGAASPRADTLPSILAAGEPLTLNDDRFLVEVGFRTPQGQSGEGQPVELTDDTGYFFFFNEANVEMVIKVLRGCPINDHYWVFAGGLTNVEVDITVTDTDTGAVQTYRNPLRAPFQPIQDTEAFATCP